MNSDIYKKIKKLHKLWEAETSCLSRPNDIMSHHAYQEIIKIGNIAVPVILSMLCKQRSNLFMVLHEITGANPIKKEHQGKTKEIVRDWIEWGKLNNYDF